MVSKKPRGRRLISQRSELLIKKQVLTHYGNGKVACVRCGFSDIRALSIDHINGGGVKHRKSLGVTSGNNFYVWLKNNDYPLEYQTLCMNCQYIKREENREYTDKGNRSGK